MRNRASFTAAWVATWRSLGVMLPEDARLADDPYGVRFAKTNALLRAPSIARTILPKGFALTMQVRTRVIDDVLLAFVRGGGAQVVILGAGFDCRALRFAHALAKATVYEIDHPATQARKREALRGDVGARTEYVPWDFEARDVRELPGELRTRGHDASKPTLTIWEGVTMYLSGEAIDASVFAVRDWSAPSSPFVFNYFDRTSFAHPTLRARAARVAVARLGEPFRFGFDPHELPTWLSAHGFDLTRDADLPTFARELLPARYTLGKVKDRRMAIARRAGP